MKNKFNKKKRLLQINKFYINKNKTKGKLITWNKNTTVKSKKHIKYFIIFIIIILYIIFILILISRKQINSFTISNIFNNIILNNPEPFYDYKQHIYSRGTTLDRGLKFIKNCREGNLLIDPSKFKYTPSPKISAVIPIYNCERTLKAAIRSIQNQDMLDIEIILINDNSNQKTLNIVNDLMKEDPRIRLINNNKRKGQFYARNIGALESRGQYIVNLDSDDMYIDIDVFNTLYYSIKDGDFDIVAHRMFEAYSFTDRYYIREHMFNKRNNLTLFQPQLSCYAISSNGQWRVNDINIWGKLYKTKIYKKAVNVLGKERYSYYDVHAEDFLMVHLLFNIANSFKFVKKYGVFHKVSGGSNSHKIKDDERIFGELFFTEIIFGFRKPECKYISVNRLIISSGDYKRANDYNKNFFIKLYKKILEANDIDESYKTNLRKSYNKYSAFNSSQF